MLTAVRELGSAFIIKVIIVIIIIVHIIVIYKLKVDRRTDTILLLLVY